ncbi:villin 1 S-like [Pelomyxa schiedti]|nr:villin 1 S-like [Pelomyxa schiedti]
MGRQLVSSIFNHYVKVHDVQTLAMLSCVFLMIDNPSWLAQSRGEDVGSPEREDFHRPKNNLFLDISCISHYVSFMYTYASLLHQWGLFTKMNELLNLLPQTALPNDPPRVFLTRCRKCGKPSSSYICPSCHIFTFRCALCGAVVKGLTLACLTCFHGGHRHHMETWFTTNTMCPTGCGCECVFPVMNPITPETPNTTPPPTAASTPTPTSTPTPAPTPIPIPFEISFHHFFHFFGFPGIPRNEMGNDQSNDAGRSTASSLHLGNRKLKEIPPDVYQHAATLSIINLSCNDIVSLVGISRLKCLTSIDVSENKISELPTEFFQLRDLLFLKLSRNVLSSLGPIGNFRQMTELNASNNALTAIPSSIMACEALRVLNLSYNSIKQIPMQLCALPSLTHLILNNNVIEQLPAEISVLTTLTLLNLAENELNEIPPAIGKLTLLGKLYLDNNNLEVVPPDIGNLVSLKEINLRSNQLASLPLKFTNLARLEICDLGVNAWCNPAYQSENVADLFSFLQNQSDAPAPIPPNKTLESKSKSHRRRESLASVKIIAESVIPQDFQIVERKKRLIRLRGDKNILLHHVDPTYESLHNSSVFIFNVGFKIFVWIGSQSPERQRMKAAYFAHQLAAEISPKTTISIIDNTQKGVDDTDFWNELGSKGPVNDAIENEEEILSDLTSQTKLFTFQERDDRLEISAISGQSLYKDALRSECCFVLDDCIDVYVWAGVFSSRTERSWAMLKAEELLEHGKRPHCAEVYLIVEGDDGEHLMFKEHFLDWVDNTWQLSKKELDNLRKEQEAQQKTSAGQDELTISSRHVDTKPEPTSSQTPIPQISEPSVHSVKSVPPQGSKDVTQLSSPSTETSLPLSVSIPTLSISLPPNSSTTTVSISSPTTSTSETPSPPMPTQDLAGDAEMTDSSDAGTESEEDTDSLGSVSPAETDDDSEGLGSSTEPSSSDEESTTELHRAQMSLQSLAWLKEREEKRLRDEEERKKIELEETQLESTILMEQKATDMFIHQLTEIRSTPNASDLSPETASSTSKTDLVAPEGPQELPKSPQVLRQEAEEKTKKEIEESEQKAESLEHQRQSLLRKSQEDISRIHEEAKIKIQEAEAAAGILEKEITAEQKIRADALWEKIKHRMQVDIKKQEADERKKRAAERRQSKLAEATHGSTTSSTKQPENQLVDERTQREILAKERARASMEQESREAEQREKELANTRVNVVIKPSPGSHTGKTGGSINKMGMEQKFAAILKKPGSSPKATRVSEKSATTSVASSVSNSATPSSSNSASILSGVTSVKSDYKIASSTKARARGPSKRSAPSHNIVRESHGSVESTSKSTSTPSQPATKPAGSAQLLGAYGILYSLKAADALFQKRKASADTPKNPDQPNLLPKDLPRLIQVKGRRRPFARQVELTWRSLNSGDCFILDSGKHAKVLYQWNGKESNRIEKGKAMDLAKNIKDKERFGATLCVVEEGREPPEFWEILGGSPNGPLTSSDNSGDDIEAEQNISQCIILYKICFVEGDNIELERISSTGSPITKSMIQPTQNYILDCLSEIFIWTNLKTPTKVKKQIQAFVEKIHAERSANIWVAPIHNEWAGSEQVMFKERFYDWLSVSIQGGTVTPGNIAASRAIDNKTDVIQMYQRKTEREQVMIDDGTGKVKIWRIEEFKQVPIPPDKHGEFYSAESYVILYSYIWKNKDCFLIYFWQGRNSSVLGKGTSAYMAVELDDKLKSSGMTKEVRVVQGKEPKHFLLVFSGKLIVHQGKDPAAKEDDTHPIQLQRGNSGKTKMEKSSTGAILYHIQGITPPYVTAVQTAPCASSLNSGSAALVVTDDVCFIWRGRFSNTHEQTFAAAMARRGGLTRPVTTEVLEGEEPSAFWVALDGKSRYPTATHVGRIDARLFQCSIGSGNFTVDEILQFSQDDLVRDDVMILDAINTVFLWIGKESHHTEQKFAGEVALEYTNATTNLANRAEGTPVLRVLDGKEPSVFTTYFHGWDGRGPQTYDEGLVSVESILQEYNRTYTYEELVAKKFPKGLDESKLEQYLSDEEFRRYLTVPRAEWSRVPTWKKDKLKKEARLF